MARWSPDWVAINDKTSNKKWVKKGGLSNFRAFHPLLLDSGDIIFTTGSALVRQAPCSSKPGFVVDQIMHHSVELDENGSAIWVPSVVQNGLTENPYLNGKIRDVFLGL